VKGKSVEIGRTPLLTEASNVAARIEKLNNRMGSERKTGLYASLRPAARRFRLLKMRFGPNRVEAVHDHLGWIRVRVITEKISKDGAD